MTTVTGASTLSSDPTCSGPNDTVDVSLTLGFNSTAATTYDLGLFVGTNGISPNTTGSSCTGAIGPIAPGLFSNQNNNTCGDITSAVGTIPWTVTTKVKCVANAENKLTVPSCRVWYQNQNGNATCSSISNLVSGTGSQCDCSTLVIPTNFIALSTLTIVKKMVPADDPGRFNLTIDGVVNAENVGDNGTTGEVVVNTGLHVVGETAVTGTDLADYDQTISCTSGTAANANVVAGQNTTCTITNTRKTTQACRILRLTSSIPVALSSQSTPTRTLFGTGAFNATCTGTSCSIVIKANEGMFTGNGLIYNDGQFPVATGCTGPWDECFPTQTPNPFTSPVALPAFNLTGLVLSGGGGTITFGNGTYTYTGATFANHSGSYTLTDCDNVVPEPGSLPLVLLSLAGLGLAGWYQARRRSGARAARIH